MPVVKAKQTIDELSSGKKRARTFSSTTSAQRSNTMITGPQQVATADIPPDYDRSDSDNSVDSAIAAQHTTESNLQPLIFHS
ncbi:hypothetical protein C442_14915 [Haloarcula amylolytica JCM 13557]|uniref:Uncharacterized protein n=1 Tax=Haloarcula amylolytica JCM 13557 TaxID=1227452 RepID=M0KBG0_9EURY|nr:hypothetical protein C442_14915 [Haloarcula amylolytica JCM 13557]